MGCSVCGATEHSGPSVSAPTVRYYPVGTELHLIGYEQGWFQVLDPVTSQRGWIYEKYYLQAIRGPGQMVALQEPAKRQQKPTLHVRRAKSLAPLPAKKISTAHRKCSPLPIRNSCQHIGQGTSTVVR